MNSEENIFANRNSIWYDVPVLINLSAREKAMKKSNLAEKFQAVVDHKGKKTAVLLPIEKYEQMVEDLEDLRVIAERKKEPTLSYKQLVAKLKRHGLV